MANHPSSDLDAVKSDLAALRADLTALSQSLLRRGVKGVKEAKSTIEDGVAEAAGSFEAMAGSRPYTTVLLAFGAGVVAASLLRRR